MAAGLQTRLSGDQRRLDHEISLHQIHRRPDGRDRSRGSRLEAVGPAAVERLQQSLGSVGHRRGPDDAGAARRHPRRAVQRRRAVGRGDAAAARRAGRRRSGRRAAAARGPDPADHRPHDGARVHHRRARPRDRARAAARGRRRRRRGQQPRAVRGHRQGARLPRLPRAPRPARLGGPQQLGPARHPASEHRRRSDRRAQALRVRRHAQHRPEQHHSQRRAAAASRRRRHGRQPASTSTTPI